MVDVIGARWGLMLTRGTAIRTGAAIATRLCAQDGTISMLKTAKIGK